jgi:hypothetical protein
MRATGGERPFGNCTAYMLFREEQRKLIEQAERNGTLVLTQKEQEVSNNARISVGKTIGGKVNKCAIIAHRWKNLTEKQKTELQERARSRNREIDRTCSKTVQ